MLINELIVRHLGPQGAVHERGIELLQTQTPPGARIHREVDGAVAPVAGDLLLVRAPVGTGLRERVDTDLPVGVTVVLLFETEVTDLPVGRLLAALAVAQLQVVEASVVSGTPVAKVAVVAIRTDELVVPRPYLAHELEPGDHSGPAVLRRLLGEHTLEGLVQRARERVLKARLAEVATELEQATVNREEQEAVVQDRDNARREVDTERERIRSLQRELDSARAQVVAADKRMLLLRSSTTFKVASRLARASGVGRRIFLRSRRG